MTTVRDVVTLALQQGRVIGVSASPTSSEANAGLQAFQGMLDAWVADGMFGTLTDTYLETDDIAEEGRRYLLASGATLTFPSLIAGQGGDYGEEGNTSSRQIFDLSLVESVTSTGVRTVKLWDRKEWVDLLGLTLNDDAPLASRGLPGLAACVARTYCEMFGRDLGSYTQAQARRFEGSLSYKFGSTRPTAKACYF